jgi:hypothetical protein
MQRRMMSGQTSGTIATDMPRPGKPVLMHRLLRWMAIGGVILIGLVAVALFNNNFSLTHRSRVAFNAQLDADLDHAIGWIATHPRDSETNPALMYMISDMERMSGDTRLRTLLNDYAKHLSASFDPLDSVWSRLANREAAVPMLSGADLRGAGFEQKWDAYGIAPNNVQLTTEGRADMFSPTKYYWGLRHHQLLALVIYRDFNGGSPDLDRTMSHLSEKIARDAHYDFRVSDSYVQRTAFVLAAGRPDLIRDRWVERILDYQTSDGTWKYCWYGWCRGIFEFEMSSYSVHPTVQAAWALCMLKYRYPEWINEHYR